MVVDARALGQGDVFETDVCVVGAGPAGITLALELARSGCRVCLLESGGRSDSAASEKLSAGKSVGYWYYSLADTRVRAFGGTSVRWLTSPADAAEGWRARPLDPVDFERRADMPYSGWPFGYSELRPFYERAHHVCRLGPYDYALARWETPDAQRLPLNGRITTAIFQHGFEGFASYYDEVARSERVQLVLNATVIEVETDGPAGGVTSVVVAPRPPVRVPVKARLYVLAAGGIENARLLLLSRRSQPAGLGNGEDLVGRFFMERLTGRIGFIAPPGGDFVGRLALYRQLQVADTSVKAVLCPSADVLRREGLLNCAFYLVPDSRAGCSDGVRAAATLYRALRRRPLPGGLAAHAGAALRGLPDIALAHAPTGRRPQPELVALRVQAEQAPNPESRVSLDEASDSFGLPRARVDWRIAERDRWSIRRVQEILDQELRSRGLGRVEKKLGDENPPSLFLGSFHHMGTTRMHESPKHGVVDQNCQVHGVENLFVAGSSVFPTSGFANPTLTIVALSLRLADHIKGRLAL
jgi:choline dehydrogenase-like flavoprotein